MSASSDSLDRKLSAKSEDQKLSGVVIGLLSGFDYNNLPLVVFPGNPREEPIPAKSLAAVSAEDANREVALVFENGNPSKPVLIGLLQHPKPELMLRSEELNGEEGLHPVTVKDVEPASLHIDGRHIELKSEHEITLRCGRSSITLTRAGKILIRGTYLLSRSSGVNRIKGGSVQIN